MNSSTLNSSNHSFKNNCKEWVTNFCIRVPIFVRTIILLTTIIYIVNLWADIESYFSNTPKYTVDSLKIWTLLTSCLVNTHIINLIFAFISWIPDGIRLESSNGTIKYILNFFINNIVIQIIFIVICYILSLGYESLVLENSLGLWPVIMAEVTMLCIANPENYVNLCFIPFEFRAKFYPFAMYLFLIVANGFKFIIIDVLIGILFGYLYFYKLKNFLNVSDSLVLRLEKIFQFLTKFTGTQLILS